MSLSRIINHSHSFTRLEIYHHIYFINFIVVFSGEFWVDPNEGAPEDAIQAYCDFSFNATCLYSSRESKVTLLYLNCKACLKRRATVLSN